MAKVHDLIIKDLTPFGSSDEGCECCCKGLGYTN